MGKHVPKNARALPQGRHYMPRCFQFGYRRKIGVLGGSFNPAHEGHLALSEQARKSAQCDEIWWLVSPQNPLKSAENMADFQTRLNSARQIAKGKSWLRVLDIEYQAKINKSSDVMRLLRQRARKARFIWLMGSDNLIQLPKWHEAQRLPYLMPFMVLRRGDDFYPSIKSKGRYLCGQKGRVRRPQKLFSKKPPALYVDTAFHNPISATIIRAQQKAHRLS